MSESVETVETKPKTVYRINGEEFEDVEHIVWEHNPDLALCGVDQEGVPWNQGLPPCLACLAVLEGEMN